MDVVNANRLEKLVRRTGSVLGVELNSIQRHVLHRMPQHILRFYSHRGVM